MRWADRPASEQLRGDGKEGHTGLIRVDGANGSPSRHPLIIAKSRGNSRPARILAGKESSQGLLTGGGAAGREFSAPTASMSAPGTCFSLGLGFWMSVSR